MAFSRRGKMKHGNILDGVSKAMTQPSNARQHASFWYIEKYCWVPDCALIQPTLLFGRSFMDGNMYDFSHYNLQNSLPHLQHLIICTPLNIPLMPLSHALKSEMLCCTAPALDPAGPS